jgi:hypothetical protein
MSAARACRIGAILWALIIAAGVILLGGALILPSTKRAHLDFHERPGAQASSDSDSTTQP